MAAGLNSSEEPEAAVTLALRGFAMTGARKCLATIQSSQGEGHMRRVHVESECLCSHPLGKRGSDG